MSRKIGSRKLLIYGILQFLAIFLMGCGNQSDIYGDKFYEEMEEEAVIFEEEASEKADRIYQDAMERLMSNEDVEEMEGTDIFDKLRRRLLRNSWKTYNVIRVNAPMVVAWSISVGILIIVFSTHNKQLRRFGLVAFVIGIPAAIIIIVFGIGIFNEIFVY